MRKNHMVQTHRNRAFTLVEMLVVISIIALLASFILAALGGSKESAKTLQAEVKLKEIGLWMELWAGDNNGKVLPSQFDFVKESENGTNITVRRDTDAPDDNPNDSIARGQHQGTWADILWTDNSLHVTYGLRDMTPGGASRWESDSPDDDIYDVHDSFNHPLRSTFMNTRGSSKDLPGYFAANNFFDARSGADGNPNSTDPNSKIDRYYTYDMLSAPSRSIYIVDSIAGETIETSTKHWQVNDPTTGGGIVTHDNIGPTGDIDFRYGDDCMVLLLDGSVNRLAPWTVRGPETPPSGALDYSLLARGYRVHQLTKRKPTK